MFANIPGARLYYERVGEGLPVLWVNGSGSDLRNRPNHLDLPGMSEIDVCTYDHRGLGRSVPDDPDELPTMAGFAADALALADALGWERFRLIGVSFGGMVAQEIAIAAGARVERLVLACTSAGGAGGSSYPLHEVYPLPFERRIDELVRINDDRNSAEPARAAATRQVLLARATDAAPDTGFLRQLEARRHHDTWDRLPALRVPTLVAAGRNDGIAPLRNGEALCARIPRARLAVFNGGHGFLWEDPAAWPLLRTFLTAPGF